MKLRRIAVVFLLALSVLLGSIGTALAAYNLPYYIIVDVTNQITTVYSAANGSVVRQMLCCTGRKNATPLGDFKLPAPRRSSERHEWYWLALPRCYVKYATRIVDSFLFHSFEYKTTDNASVYPEDVANLGYPVSHGCVRLREEDAKWIAHNCGTGTAVRIYKSNEPNEDLRDVLFESGYSIDDGLTYDQFLNIPTDPNVFGRFSSGDEVQNLQNRLRALGFFDGEADGNYRTSTMRAVLSVQKMLGLERTGQATPEFREMIYSSDAPTSYNVDLDIGSSGPVVATLQRNLKALKLYDGEIDRIYGPSVKESVRKFQSAYGSVANGIADATLLTAIEYEVGRMALLFGEDYDCDMSSDTVGVGIVSADNASAYQTPSAKANHVQIEKGLNLIVCEVQGNWARVLIDGLGAFVPTVYLDISQQENLCLTYSAGTAAPYAVGHTAEEYQNGAGLPIRAFKRYVEEGGSLDLYDGYIEVADVNTGDGNAMLNLRAEPNAESDVLTTLANGTRLSILFKGPKWSLVSDGEHRGFLLSDYLSFEVIPEGDWTVSVDETLTSDELRLLFGTYEIDSLNATVNDIDGQATVFDISGIGGSPIGTLSNGTTVTVLEIDEYYACIAYAGYEGYVRNGSLIFSLP